MLNKPVRRTIARDDTATKDGVLTGHASVSYDGTERTEYLLWEEENIKHVERIAPGAFDGVLEDDVRCLVNHDSNRVLGRTPKTLKLSTDSEGLKFENDIPDTTHGRDITVLVERGDVDGCSFSFTIDHENDGVEWTAEEGKNVRTIKRLKQLFDVGPVTFPAYEATSVSVRDREELETERRSMMREEPPPNTDEPESRKQADLDQMDLALANIK